MKTLSAKAQAIRHDTGSRGDTMTSVIPYGSLATSDLIVDAVYEGDAGGQLGGEPLSKLLPGVGNMGGFRAAGNGEDKKLVVLYSTGENRDWPDRIDHETGRYFYFGDNRTPGRELHDTDAGGNKILRRVFDLLHMAVTQRSTIPPFLIFNKYPTAVSSRSVQFRGIAVPGYPGSTSTSDLIAIWKRSENQRFQNYQAAFTILDIPVLSRAWIGDILSGNPNSPSAPSAWKEWILNGSYDALTAASTTVIRSIDEQTPDTDQKKAILDMVWNHFKETPIAFEAFAARVFQLHDQRVIIDEITRGAVDGGRDAVGRYLLGLSNDPVYAEFSLEAKCYRPPTAGGTATTVGVKEVSRLISRIRHRQFGVLVTTSVIARQAYEEVREDKHPIIFISGKDISDILTDHGFSTPQSVKEFLDKQFPIVRSAIA